MLLQILLLAQTCLTCACHDFKLLLQDVAAASALQCLLSQLQLQQVTFCPALFQSSSAL